MKKIIVVLLSIMLISTSAYAFNPYVRMYAEDGRTLDVFYTEVDAYKKVGWFENESDVKTTLYALDGRTVSVYKSHIESYKQVGWYEYSEYLKYYQSIPFFSVISDNYVNDLAMGMTYADFYRLYSDEIVSVSDIYISEMDDSKVFTVNVSDAEFMFSTYSAYGATNSYRLSSIRTSGTRWNFARGINVGKSVAFVKERVPYTGSVNLKYSGSSYYIYDYDTMTPLWSMPNNKLVYAMHDDGETIFIFLGYYNSEAYAVLKLHHSGGIVNSIELIAE